MVGAEEEEPSGCQRHPWPLRFMVHLCAGLLSMGRTDTVGYSGTTNSTAHKELMSISLPLDSAFSSAMVPLLYLLFVGRSRL